MQFMAIGFAFVGLVITLTGGAVYLNKLKQSRAPKHPVGFSAALISATVIGTYAVYLAWPSALSTVITVLPLLFTAMLAFVFFFFLGQKNPPLNDIKIKVGEPILPFTVPAHDGSLFDSEKLKGRRTLLKFFRGSWCPYCSAELKMFEQMRAELEAKGIDIVALSDDTIEQAQLHHQRDQLQFTLLSDPSLRVIRAYGVEHHKALGFKSENIKQVLGLSMAMLKPSYRSMAIPTSVLVDEFGVVQWIDQSEDYRLRASKDSVMAAIERSFN
ncbi:peroxiredoxin family protein [Ferrimonas lipolytica]|uniref:Peroxiredoxin family protein n=1 Tax=Ferrimonas lipolytica TaxID=2724191 RepID=A0A6H1UDD3_9GAMM|nr:peroxiredoxin family protein [Ferrimonas lipolytica]QIZ75812.1 peroxiredoxin family protein [Ferrimonas lipolytica]